RPLWKSILVSPCYTHYQDHLSGFLQRTDPSLLFTPDPSVLQHYTGTYRGTPHRMQKDYQLTFHLTNNQLLLSTLDDPDSFIPIPIDNTHISYPGYGLVIFHPTDDGPAISLESGITLFTRIL